MTAATFHMPARAGGPSPVIGVRPGQILTDRLMLDLKVKDGSCVADLEREGRDAAAARDLLEQCHLAQQSYLANRDRLRDCR